MNASFWHNKNVFITGHTGFKGGWLSFWLTKLGAKVFGYALEPNTKHNFFDLCKINRLIDKSTIGDIRNYESLYKAINDSKADIVFHLAAQPLVRDSYTNPLNTYSTNVMGTANLFEAIRNTKTVKAVINITTDKCYENKEWSYPYRENDALGGIDPYSNSKACSELVTQAYRDSFFKDRNVYVASARAGNVIGGGDWSKDRLIPDIIRSIENNNIVEIRYPKAIRPWQHVLDPLSGYMLLAEKLFSEGEIFSQAFNFGPNNDEIYSVQEVINHTRETALGNRIKWMISKQTHPHEANLLALDTSKSKKLLKWVPKIKFVNSVEYTMTWYEKYFQNESLLEITEKQINNYKN